MCAIAFVGVLHGATARSVLAQTASETAAPSPTPATTDRGPETGSPRAAVRGFLEAADEGRWDGAASYLDVSRLPREGRDERAEELARELKAVLDRTLWIDLDEVSAQPSGADDGLPPDREMLGTIETRDGSVPIVLQRQRGEDGALVWRFSASTVRQIPALDEEFGSSPLADWLPPVFFDVRFFGLELWQWVGLAVVALAAALLSWVGVAVAKRILAPVARRSASPLDDRAIAIAGGPARLALGSMIFASGERLLLLPIWIATTLSALEGLLVIVAAAWLSLRLLDLFSRRLGERLVRRGQYAAMPLLPPGRKAAKVIVVGFAVIVALDALGFQVTAILAGLGVGGIAVALAAQKTIENLFGGITLFADQPVRVGDFCRFGDRVGTVEEIGLRSTRIRTLDRTIVTIPNAEFANLQLENYTRRDKIWYHPTIGLRYETSPEQVRWLIVEITRMLRGHAKVDPDGARIRFVGFGASSLDFEVFAYVRETDFGEYLKVAEDLNLRIMEIVAEAGSSFAFPSQTTYLETGTGLDVERSREAERQVAAHREAGTLDLPRFDVATDAAASAPRKSPAQGERGRR